MAASNVLSASSLSMFDGGRIVKVTFMAGLLFEFSGNGLRSGLRRTDTEDTHLGRGSKGR
jgi:hypothetical protein